MSKPAALRGVTGPPGSRLAKLLGGGLAPVAPLRGVWGCLERIVDDVSASEGPTASRGLPEGRALAEAIAVRLRASGSTLRWDPPAVVPDLSSLLEICQERGRSSVDLYRADASLLSGMQLGAWFDAPWRTRMLRRAPRPVRRAARSLAPTSRRWLAAAADLSFWEGVREAATATEWRRLTSSSYVALVYHRFAGEKKPGQERIDISPRRFTRQLRALRLAGFRPLSAQEMLAFHSGETARLPRRRFAITVDDAIADCVPPLERHAGAAPQLFVPAAELGGVAHWVDGEPVADWDDVRSLAAAGVAIGSHGLRHRRLPALGDEERAEELAGSLAELRAHVPEPLPVFAFPNGDHDARTCAELPTAGYRAGFTTEKGRNGAGTNPYCLRRVSVHARDGVLAILWKVVTGEALPAAWLRLRAFGRRSQP